MRSFLNGTLGYFLILSGKEPLYDVGKDFCYNVQKKYPISSYYSFRDKKLSGRLFDYPINSPIGIPACAIMTSSGIRWAANNGFDILTYKTVRSTPCDGNSFPNILLLKTSVEDSIEKFEVLSPEEEYSSDSITVANSIGIPSFSLEWTLKDIIKAREALTDGQVLIVSIFGMPSEKSSVEEDFAYLAKKVTEAGAHIVEINLSCPNIHSKLLYKEPKAVYQITKAVTDVVDVPVILKVGLFDADEQMREVLKIAESAGAKGICGINTIPKEIVDKQGKAAFGKDRKIAGVSGEHLRPKALDFIRKAKRIIQEEELDLLLFATGGVMRPEHFALFLKGGADIALSATGSIWNPDLAISFHEKNRKKRDNSTMKKYLFKPYNENFPKLYEKEKKRVLDAIGDCKGIHHVGSTAVPNLGGKGIIDIAVVAREEDLDPIKDKLHEIGYQLHVKGSSSDRFFFWTDLLDEIEGKRRYHLHLILLSSLEWREMLRFRDYLCSHQDALEEYASLKKNLAERVNHDGERYRLGKDSFFKKILTISK